MTGTRTSFYAALALVTAVAAAGSTPAFAQGAPASEVDKLKEQVQRLETQNREVLEALKSVKQQLDEMKKGAPAAAPAAPVAAPAGDAPKAPVPGKPIEDKALLAGVLPAVWTIGNSKLKFYGFIRLDSIYNDSPMGNGGSTTNNQLPFFVRSEDSHATGAIKGDANNDSWSHDVRLTRIGMDFEGGEMDLLAKGKVGGKIELDFDSGLNPESRDVPRFRHAYLTAKWGDLTLLAGQTWDVISPLMPTVNDHTVMWNAGNLGDRRPQFRVSYEPAVGAGRFSLRTMVGATGAVDNRDADGDGTLDGSASGLPMFEGRIGYALPLWVEDQNADLGFWGHTAWEEQANSLVNGEDDFYSWCVGGDLTLPLIKDLTWKTELWLGQGLADVRGGIGQFINAAGDEIDAWGGWTELSYKATTWWTPAIGYTIDDPNNEELDAQGRELNTAYYVSNAFYPGANTMFKVNYIHWETEYKRLEGGADNRVELIVQYSF